jgi:hypothetical protein
MALVISNIHGNLVFNPDTTVDQIKADFKCAFVKDLATNEIVSTLVAGKTYLLVGEPERRMPSFDSIFFSNQVAVESRLVYPVFRKMVYSTFDEGVKVTRNKTTEMGVYCDVDIISRLQNLENMVDNQRNQFEERLNHMQAQIMTLQEEKDKYEFRIARSIKYFQKVLEIAQDNTPSTSSANSLTPTCCVCHNDFSSSRMVRMPCCSKCICKVCL